MEFADFGLKIRKSSTSIIMFHRTINAYSHQSFIMSVFPIILVPEHLNVSVSLLFISCIISMLKAEIFLFNHTP